MDEQVIFDRRPFLSGAGHLKYLPNLDPPAPIICAAHVDLSTLQVDLSTLQVDLRTLQVDLWILQD